MSSLHTISKSWFDSVWLYEQLAFASDGDAILLMQDAVLAAQSPVALSSFMAKCQLNNISVYGLDGDMQLRGITSQYADLKVIDYSGFVQLMLKHNKQVAW